MRNKGEKIRKHIKGIVYRSMDSKEHKRAVGEKKKEEGAGVSVGVCVCLGVPLDLGGTSWQRPQPRELINALTS